MYYINISHLLKHSEKVVNFNESKWCCFLNNPLSTKTLVLLLSHAVVHFNINYNLYILLRGNV